MALQTVHFSENLLSKRQLPLRSKAMAVADYSDGPPNQISSQPNKRHACPDSWTGIRNIWIWLQFLIRILDPDLDQDTDIWIWQSKSRKHLESFLGVASFLLTALGSQILGSGWVPRCIPPGTWFLVLGPSSPAPWSSPWSWSPALVPGSLLFMVALAMAKIGGSRIRFLANLSGLRPG